MTHVIPLALALLATTPIDEEQDWPRSFSTPNGTASVYTPQLEALRGDQLTARAAVSYEPKGGEALFGVAFFSATVDVDRDNNLVTVRSVKVTKLRFPGVTAENEAQHAATLGAEMSRWDLSISLDLVVASIQVAEKERSTPGIKSSPPKILVATVPTVLVSIDGEPKLTKIEGTTLQRVLNTQFLIVQDPAASKFFLTSGAAWFAAPEVKGPWASVEAPTAAVVEWYSKSPPPPPPEDEPPATIPTFIVVNEPTELLQFEGKPDWKPVSGGGLLAATNTDSDVYRELSTQQIYVLLTGRWFTAKSLEGPWTAVANDKLPADFKKIPPESEEAHVLAFVSGTPQAQDALADTQVPTTSTVKKTAGKDLAVKWEGEPQFKAIEGTKLSYGVNTTFSVLLVEGKYWVCHQAVWYFGPSPKGPWTVAESRPPGIDTLPASAPVYNVKYVYVYDVQPEVVVVGYLPGYVGIYPYHGVVVYGTGYYYPPYITPYVYIPPPVTFGVHIGWNPWMGWGVGVSFGTPYMRVGIYFGGYHHHHCYGPVGYRPIPPPYHRPGYPPPGHRPAAGYPPGHRPSPVAGRPAGGGSPSTLPSGGARPGSPGASQLPAGGGARPGGSPGASQLPAGGGARPGGPGASQLPAGGGTRPGGGVGPSQQPSNLYQRPDNANRNAARPSQQPVAPSSVGGRPNNVYGGANGDVYRRDSGGGWEQRQGSGWSPSQQPSQRPQASPQPSQNMNRDYSARQRSSGSYGGGSRGGGGGRRR